jgi:hypothetical protein
MKERCTTTDYRRIRRWKHEVVLGAMQQRLDRQPEMMSAAQNSRASVRNDQALDGLDALPDEDAGATSPALPRSARCWRKASTSTLRCLRPRYGHVATAYVSGLRNRAVRGLFVARIASVVIFCLSSLDRFLDRQLDGVARKARQRSGGSFCCRDAGA